MSDPITLGVASTAVSLVNGTIGLLKEAREAAKRSEDHDLKSKLSDVYDSVIDLKAVLNELREENEALRKQLETKAALSWDRDSKLYFAVDDPDPFCPTCFQKDGRPIRLQPIYTRGKIIRQECKVCHSSYSAGSAPEPTSSGSPNRAGRDGWMA